jgi:hypothetical protein
MYLFSFSPSLCSPRNDQQQRACVISNPTPLNKPIPILKRAMPSTPTTSDLSIHKKPSSPFKKDRKEKDIK